MWKEIFLGELFVLAGTALLVHMILIEAVDVFFNDYE